jgi:hypothetical protein
MANYAEEAAKARIMELLRATDSHKNNVFPSLFPYLKELGWKYAVDEHSSATVFLTPWASKIDGAILLDGHCSLGRLGHNFDYFVDGQSAVTYLRTYGFNRTLRPGSLSGTQAVAVGRKRCNEQNVIVHGTARSQKSNMSGQ